MTIPASSVSHVAVFIEFGRGEHLAGSGVYFFRLHAGANRGQRRVLRGQHHGIKLIELVPDSFLLVTPARSGPEGTFQSPGDIGLVQEVRAPVHEQLTPVAELFRSRWSVR
jgi:hypothetical protein